MYLSSQWTNKKKNVLTWKIKIYKIKIKEDIFDSSRVQQLVQVSYFIRKWKVQQS